MPLFWNLLLAGQQPVGIAVNLLIVLLFLVAFFDITRARLRLSRERVLVKKARAKLRGPAQTAVESAVAAHSAEKLEKDLGIPSHTLLGHRVERVLRLRLAGLGSRDVLQQLTSERLGSYGSLARQIGSSLTLLGLLGTVFGLSLALVNVGNTSVNIKGVEDLSRLSAALAGTMGGMKTAFSCTLVGLMMAVILSFLNFALRRKQSVALAEIEEFTACDLLPAIDRVDPEAEQATRAFVEVLSKLSEDLNLLSGNLLGAAQEYRSSASEVRGTLDSLVGSVNQFSVTINRVAGNQEEFTRTMTDTRAAVTGVGTTVQSLQDMLTQHLLQIRQNVEATAGMQQSILSHHEEFKKLAETLRKSQEESIGSALTSHEKASKDLIDRVLKEHLQELKGLSERHNQSLQGFVSQGTQVMTSVADMVFDLHSRLNANGKNRAAAGGVKG